MWRRSRIREENVEGVRFEGEDDDGKVLENGEGYVLIIGGNYRGNLLNSDVKVRIWFSEIS
jgi:hypothetical protein